MQDSWNLETGEIPEGSPPVNDRLASTLFLAALFHGMIILGVTFGAQTPIEAPANPMLEVILVSELASEDVAPEEAEYLADQTLKGGGNTTDRVTPTSAPRSQMDMPNPGAPEGNHLVNVDPGQVTENTNLVVTDNSSEQNVVTAPDTSVQPFEQRLTAKAMTADDAEDEAITKEEDTTRVRSEEVRELYISANTRESSVANYLVSWKQKIEKVGTVNFPEAARNERADKSPVLEVAIRSDGLLEEIIVRESSGNKSIDRAALSILRLAAPFDPFPSELRKEYDVLRFAYEWQFRDSAMMSAAAPQDTGTQGT